MAENKYNAVKVDVTKQVREAAIILVTDEELTDIKNSNGEMDAEAYQEMLNNDLAFPLAEDREEEIQEVELTDVEGEEEE